MTGVATTGEPVNRKGDVVTGARSIEVVVPVYNEQRSLPGCLRVLHRYLTENIQLDWTITVVDNGSTDATFRVASELADEMTGVLVRHMDSKGRGLALRTAWGESKADIVVYMDVDLSTGLDALVPLIAPLTNGHSDIAIGSRLAPGARTIRGPKREMISRCYNAIIRLSHGARFSDAQCGFKAARTDVIRPLLRHLEDDSWFFDTELLLLAEHNDLRVHEVPVDWVEDADTRVRVTSTAIADLRGLVRVARNKATGIAKVANLPRRPDPAPIHPNASVTRRETGLLWQILSFSLIGAISTVATLLLYAVFRQFWSPLPSNLVALTVTTLFNTEANRRLTFIGAGNRSTGRAHIQGLVLFALYYAFTSGALLVLHAVVSHPSTRLELAVLLLSSAIGTVGRFVALRGWVFNKHRQGGTTMTTARSAPTVTPSPRRPDAAPGRRWEPFALAAIVLLSIMVNFWGMASAGWGNAFYSAAVRSMSDNATNFLFGSFDPAGLITVDKPPFALWPQVVSTWIFGFHGWAVLLPQAIAGAGAVFLLHRTVRRWTGEHAALLAALALAITPVAVAVARTNIPDMMLTLLAVAAAYAVTRAVAQDITARSATKWLLLAAFLVGCGFLTKMLAAYLILPALVLAYLFGRSASWARRAFDLAAAGVVLLASSLWWVGLTAIWSGAKPFIGGSTDGTALDLVLGYNGFGRLFGVPEPGGSGGDDDGGGGGGGSLLGSDPGLLRMFGPGNGGQISWLIPVAALALLAVAVAGVVNLRRGVRGDRTRRAGWLLWGGWLGVVGLVFSYQQLVPPYYTVLLAPAIAAVFGAGTMALWRFYRRPGGVAWLLLPAAILLSAALAWVVVSRDMSWHGWLRYAVLAVSAAAVVGLVAARFGAGQRLVPVAGAATVVALLLAPAVWSMGTAFGPSRAMATGGTFTAGPPFTIAFPDRPGMLTGEQMMTIMREGVRPDGRTVGGAEGLSDQQLSMLDYVRDNAGDTRIPLAIEGGSIEVSTYLLYSDTTVVGLGGFIGADPSPTANDLSRLRDAGELAFVYSAGDPRMVVDMFGGGGETAMERANWVAEHCTAVPPSVYGAPAPASPQVPIPNFLGGNADTLFDCRRT